MEMTMTSPLDLNRADFSNQTACRGTFPPMTTVAGTLIGWFAGPGLAVASPTVPERQLPARQDFVIQASSAVEAKVMNFAPAGELIERIKEGWSLNMTELAELLGVQRPTLYNWLNGKTSPDSNLQKHLQTLAATAADWQEATAGSNWDFLFDYTGPRADEVTIREVLSRADANPNEIRELIDLRLKQYQEAYARSREILGEPLPTPKTSPPESARRLNALWAKNAKKLHAARNRDR